ncbi:MAG: lysylphosphatidylglycerol synthase domain-containing protein [Pseudomonadota bacterium]|nr:MAG: hypothetical protein DIU78_08445 [Pseudomonadota bacterium]
MSDAEGAGVSSAPAASVVRLKRWLRPVLGLLAFAFVVATAIDLAARWDERAVAVDVRFAIASLVPVVAGVLIQGIAWVALAERMAGQPTPRRAALALYFDSQLARYTPGKVGLPIVRMAGAPRLGLTARLVGTSVLIEMLSWCATGALVGLLLITATSAPTEGLVGILGQRSGALLGLPLLGAALLVAVDRQRLPAKVRGLLGLDGAGPLAPPSLALLQVVYWLTWAAHGYLLARALGAESAPAAGTAGFSPLANVLGFLALAAPAGVGVREAVLVAGMSPVLGAPGALAAAVLSRVASLVADVGVWGLARLAAHRAP